MVIQSAFRGARARGAFSAKTHAATRIQAAWRGFAVRLAAKRARAAMNIQAAARGMITRRHLATRAAAASIVQAWWRAAGATSFLWVLWDIQQIGSSNQDSAFEEKPLDPMCWRWKTIIWWVFLMVQVSGVRISACAWQRLWLRLTVVAARSDGSFWTFGLRSFLFRQLHGVVCSGASWHNGTWLPPSSRFGIWSANIDWQPVCVCVYERLSL